MRNIVFNKASWTVSNKSNRELFEDYLVGIKSKDRRESRIRQYSSEGKMILCYIQPENRKSFTYDQMIHNMPDSTKRTILRLLKENFTLKRVIRCLSLLEELFELDISGFNVKVIKVFKI